MLITMPGRHLRTSFGCIPWNFAGWKSSAFPIPESFPALCLCPLIPFLLSELAALRSLVPFRSDAFWLRERPDVRYDEYIA